MKKFIAICCLSLHFPILHAQRENTDSLRKILANPPSDSAAVFALAKLSAFYSYVDPDTALFYAEEAIQKSRTIKYTYGEILGHLGKAEALDRVGEYGAALNMCHKSLRLAQNNNDHKESALAAIYQMISHLNSMNNNDSLSVKLLHTAIQHYRNSGDQPLDVSYCFYQLAFFFMKLDRIDSALYYMNKGGNRSTLADFLKNPVPFLISGNIYLYGTDSLSMAKYYFLQGMEKSKQLETPFLTCIFYTSYGETLLHHKFSIDSGIYYLRESLAISQKYRYKLFELHAASLFAYVYEYERRNTDSALKYVKMVGDVNQDIFNTSKAKQFDMMGYEEEKRQRELEVAQNEFRQRNRQYLLGGGLIAFLVIAFILLFNNRRKQKLNTILRQQKEKTEKTLDELKATQSQLIQSEKMASLGSLTAGIAHEIQNPLNFVNNFSEVNAELLDEMKTAIAKNNLQDVSELAAEIGINGEKILFHGKRADDIVKSMLQHSRIGTGQKEPADINALADEYLRLAFHGIRARDKSFNADLKIEFDPNIGKINIVAQDIGRVLLNLYNNAFYAVSAKSSAKALARAEAREVTGNKTNLSAADAVAEKKNADPDFKPQVILKTEKKAGNVLITVKDNGNGIPEKLIEKIFQPFFTTKPTGQGTGLGLSLSYDIIKAHGGEIKVTSNEGHGSEFLIILHADS